MLNFQLRLQYEAGILETKKLKKNKKKIKIGERRSTPKNSGFLKLPGCATFVTACGPPVHSHEFRDSGINWSSRMK